MTEQIRLKLDNLSNNQEIILYLLNTIGTMEDIREALEEMYQEPDEEMIHKLKLVYDFVERK